MIQVASHISSSISDPASECLATSKLKEQQLFKLKSLIENLLQNNAFYRNRLNEHGIKSGDIKSLADLKNLPFTTKADLQDNYPHGLFSVPIKDVSRFHCSSGSKGKPIVVGYTAQDLNIWSDVCARSLACAGVSAGDIIQNSYGYGLFTGGLGVHYGAERLGATVVPASGGMTRRQITLLQDLRASVLCCTPTYALNIADQLEELEIPLHTLNLRIGIFGAEPWSEEMRQQLEKKLSIKALDIYGLSEIIGPGVSIECPHSQEENGGMHVWEDHFLAEIIDPKTGEPLADGEEGELVFTTLTKEAIPLLRYRTGDISSLNRKPCSCGRTMTRMARVKARLDDMLIIRGVNFFPSAVEQILLNHPDLSSRFLLVVDREKSLDTICLQVEIDRLTAQKWKNIEESDYCAEHSGNLQSRLKNEIKNILKDMLAISADVELLLPGTLPQNESKAVRVHDKRR